MSLKQKNAEESLNLIHQPRISLGGSSRKALQNEAKQWLEEARKDSESWEKFYSYRKPRC